MIRNSKMIAGTVVATLSLAFPTACNKPGFNGEKRSQPEPVDPSKGGKSPTETNVNPGTKGQPTAKSVILQLLPTPPDSWWNNCVTVVYKGQTYDAGCSKTGGGLKALNIPVAAADACAPLAFHVKTFKNQGDACTKGLAAGQACEGPYGDTPEFDRASDSASGAAHFRWAKTSAQAESSLAFEDQPAENLAAGTADPARAAELGIDFNDVGIRIVPQGVDVVVQQTPAQGAGAAAACK